MEVDQRRKAFFYPNGAVSNTEQITQNSQH